MSYPGCDIGSRKMKHERPIMTTRTNENESAQMEMEMAGSKGCPRRARRMGQARWWFDQMRQVVEQAQDWEEAPRFQSEPVQIQLPEAARVERN
jgi:hypothetical protein